MQTLTDAAVRDALLENGGDLAQTARAFGLIRLELTDFVSRRPALIAIVVDLRDQLVDDALRHLHDGVAANQPWALRETLNQLGGRRGYGRDSEFFDPFGPSTPPPEPVPILERLTEPERVRLQELLGRIQLDEQPCEGRLPPQQGSPSTDQAA